MLTVAIGVVIASHSISSARTVVLDYYFNHEVHKGDSGTPERFHYMWEDKANTGFSILAVTKKRCYIKVPRRRTHNCEFKVS